MIAIGIPLYRGLKDPHLQYLSRAPPHQLITQQSSLVPESRWHIVDAAVALGVEKLVLLDDDVIPHRGALDRLLAHDLPVVAGVYAFKMEWLAPHNYTRHHHSFGKWDKPGLSIKPEYPPLDGELLEADWASPGFMMLRADVMKKVTQASFLSSSRPDDVLNFSKWLTDNGHRIMVDTGVLADHLWERPLEPGAAWEGHLYWDELVGDEVPVTAHGLPPAWELVLRRRK